MTSSLADPAYRERVLDRAMSDPDFAEQLSMAIRSAFQETLISPNELDRNLEPANVVDGLFSIARAIHHLARAHEGVRTDDDHDAYHAGGRDPGPDHLALLTPLVADVVATDA